LNDEEGNMRESHQPASTEKADRGDLTPEEIAKLKRRARGSGPFYSSQQVADRLQALHKEWERTGGFDKDYMKAFLARLAEEDPPYYVARAAAARPEHS
jgi:hypothetical protein